MASDRFALTWYGNKIYFDDVSRSVFDIRDIAHAAAVMPRWTGHTNWEEDGFAYSVGQHGLWCEHYTWLQNGTRLERKCALLHDAAESFIGDLNTNAKRVCEDYRLLEDELLAGIFAAVGLPVNWAYDLPPIVKEADAAALSYEAAALCNRKMTAYISPPKERVTQLGVYPLHPRATKQMFLDRHQSLSLFERRHTPMSEIAYKCLGCGKALPPFHCGTCAACAGVLPEFAPVDETTAYYDDEVAATPPAEPAMTLPTDSAVRKDFALYRGCFRYFPAALAGVARISKLGNDKHNPGEPMHHARGKSMDHGDCILRHLMDASDLIAAYYRIEQVERTKAILDEVDQLAWRALAFSQMLHEQFGGAPLAPGAKE